MRVPPRYDPLFDTVYNQMQQLSKGTETVKREYAAVYTAIAYEKGCLKKRENFEEIGRREETFFAFEMDADGIGRLRFQ